MLKATRLGMLTEGPTEKEMDVVGRHFAYWQGLAASGKAILVGRTMNADQNTVGLAVFLAENLEAAWEIVNQDPVIPEGVMTAQVYPYRIAIFAPENAPRE